MALGYVGGKHYHVEEYVYDFAVDGGAIGNIDLSAKAGSAPLPADAVVLRVNTIVHTTLASGGAATVSIGDLGSTARHLALTAFDNAQFTVDAPKALSTALPRYVSATANDQKVSISIAVAPLTAGKMSVLVEFVRPQAALQ